jgi:phospho-N-acetylmuramoyl-pentapeptide-transferase
VLAVAVAFVLAGAVGFLDDWGKARKKENKAGLSERVKLACQILVAALFMMFIGLSEQGDIQTTLGGAGWAVDLGLGYYALGVLFLCFFGNAANFTDGLDGLAASVTAVAACALAATTTFYASEVSAFYLAVAGACVGFLWFNAHPARVFMGDTGSLALGMGLAAAAVAAKQELLLLVIGGVYLAEIVSMMIQRYVFKLRRIRHGIEYARANRVFRRAPLHHHFEELGWPETHVVVRFAVAGLVFAILGVLLAPYLSPLAGTTVLPR